MSNTLKCGVVGCDRKLFRAERCEQHYLFYRASQPEASVDDIVAYEKFCVVDDPGDSGEFIYVIEREDLVPAVKIGLSTDPERRFYELQVGCPEKLKLMGYRIANRLLESRIHWVLMPHRLRGEWFEKNDAVTRISDSVLTDEWTDLDRKLRVDAVGRR